jgi:hypothetical protein
VDPPTRLPTLNCSGSFAEQPPILRRGCRAESGCSPEPHPLAGLMSEPQPHGADHGRLWT